MWRFNTASGVRLLSAWISEAKGKHKALLIVVSKYLNHDFINFAMLSLGILFQWVLQFQPAFAHLILKHEMSFSQSVTYTSV